MFENIISPQDLNQMFIGTLTTLKLFFVTILLSLPLGLILTLLYTGKNFIIKKITGFYILILRGTPLILQMFFVFYGLPYVPVIGKYAVLGRFTACAVAFVLNYAAYFAEIFRGGLLSIDKGQYEAAKVLGLNKVHTFTKIILPQMLRSSLPAVSNETIILIKDTSLVIAISVSELMAVTKNVVNRTTNVSAFAIAALFYLVMSWVLTVFFRWLETKYRYEG